MQLLENRRQWLHRHHPLGMDHVSDSLAPSPWQKAHPSTISIISGEWCRRGLPVCDSLTWTLIGSGQNLLSWMLQLVAADRKRGWLPFFQLWRGKTEKKKGECPISSAAALPPPPCAALPSLCLSFSLFPLTHVFVREEGHLPLPDDSAFQLLEAPRVTHHVHPASAVSRCRVHCTPDTAAAAKPQQHHHRLLWTAQVSKHYSTITQHPAS